MGYSEVDVLMSKKFLAGVVGLTALFSTLIACGPDRTDRVNGTPTVTGGRWVLLHDDEMARSFRCFLGPDHAYEGPVFWCYEL